MNMRTTHGPNTTISSNRLFCWGFFPQSQSTGKWRVLSSGNSFLHDESNAFIDDFGNLVRVP